MNILVLAWKDEAHPRAGGSERYVGELVRRWAADGERVTLFTGTAAGIAAHERVDGVDVVRRGSRLGVYREARRFFAAHGRRFDVVLEVVNTRPFGVPTWPERPPVVALIHQLAADVWDAELPPPLAAVGRYWLEPRWLRAYRDTPVLTISASSAASLAASGLTDVAVVPVGADPVALRSCPSRERVPTVAFVGRLNGNKRPGDAVAALALVRRRLPDAELWIIGGGPLEATLRSNVPPGVHVYGRVGEERKRELLERAHALVVTSVREGWGLVVDEAAAAGTTTIAYAVPGLVDSVPAAGGILVEPRPDALAEALVEHLPRLMATPATTGWSGGATSWAAAAEDVLAHLRTVAGAPLQAAVPA